MRGYVARIIPVSGAHPDQGLPGGGAYPDHGLPEPPPGYWGGEAPPYPDQGLPTPPPGTFPPPSPTHPIVPAPPDTPPGAIWPPTPPPVIWPHPPSPGHPDQGLPPAPARPDQGLPPAAGHPDQSLPRPETFWVVCGIPGVGWRYICVDPSLRPSHELPSPGYPSGQPVPPPPTATPRRP